MSYFIGILSGVSDIFYLVVPKFLSLLNIGSRSIFEPHKKLFKNGYIKS